MSIDVGTIRTGVEADLRDFERGMSGMVESLRKAEAEARRIQPPLEDVAEEITEVGAAAADAAKDVDDVDDSLAALQGKARAAGTELDRTEKAARPLHSTLSGVAQGMSTVGGAAGSATGKIGTFGSSLLGAFAAGGPIALGIGAVAGGIGALVSHIREAAQESRQLEALHEVLGIASGEVDRLQASFAGLGQNIEQDVAVQILRVGTEAGISLEQIHGLAEEIRSLGDLMGGDYGGAAGQVFAQHAEAAKETATAYDGIHDAISAVRGETDAVVRSEQLRLDAAFEERAALEDQLVAAERKAEEARRAWVFSRQAGEAERETYDATRATVGELERKLLLLDEEIDRREELLVQYQLERDAEKERQEAARRREEAARLAAVREEAGLAMAARVRQMEAQLAEDRRAELRATAEEEIRLQERAVEAKTLSEEDFAAWSKARREKLRADLEAIDEEEAAAARDRAFALREVEAQAADDRVELARIAAEREIEAEKGRVDGIRYTWEEFYAWREARERKLSADIAEIRQSEAEAARKTNEQVQRDLEKKLADEERMQVAGINAASSFTRGFRRAMEAESPRDLFGGLLDAAAGLLSIIPGGQVAGAVVGGFGGFFHEGGMVGTEGRKVPRYHDGGMIVAHRGIMLPEPGPGEVPILAQSGEAVLSRRGVAAAGGPAAVQAYNSGSPPPRQAAGSPTVYIQAFDPRSTEDALGEVWEPAQYRRGMSRQDSKTIAMMRRRMGAPRAGR